MRAEDQKEAGCEAVVPKLRFAALGGVVLAAVSCPGGHSAQDWESRHVHVVRLSAPWCRVMWDLHAHPTSRSCSNGVEKLALEQGGPDKAAMQFARPRSAPPDTHSPSWPGSRDDPASLAAAPALPSISPLSPHDAARRSADESAA